MSELSNKQTSECTNWEFENINPRDHTSSHKHKKSVMKIKKETMKVLVIDDLTPCYTGFDMSVNFGLCNEGANTLDQAENNGLSV